MAKTGLVDQLVGDLVDDIVRGVFPPGSVLPSETVLAERAEVSRLTVREAITVLRTKRVLEVKHGRGTFVNSISHWSPFDPTLLVARSGDAVGAGALPKKLIEARRLVEVGVAELAAARRSEGDLEAITEALERMKQSGDDIDAIAESDIDFHQAIMAAAGNAFIAALFDPIRQLVWAARRQTKGYPQIRARAIEAHTRILRTIRDRDPESARWAMHDHLTQTEEDLDSLFTEDSEDGWANPLREA
ncbi:MAG: hypothetical protein AVDCRST_MAG01-01-3993 [uncultured Rubrobacteraceae bacterium]|uniref:HTH gntR-type domain-containing protein n=1 Tax=uncultured Rubrobacteraceae bacterium TaxID=349277 RepID=A0A6J4QHP4_9ACTN|nr:MAG: hypothetical protein AVDCRST_MAG01-01-3993 [uncultured Rubrobacteraceae bacterium]